MEIETKIELDPSDLWNAIEGEVHSAIEYAVDSAIGDLDLSDQVAECIDDYDFSSIAEDIVNDDMVRKSEIEELQKQHITLQTQFASLQRSVLNIIDALQKHFEQERNALKALSDS